MMHLPDALGETAPDAARHSGAPSPSFCQWVCGSLRGLRRFQLQEEDVYSTPPSRVWRDLCASVQSHPRALTIEVGTMKQCSVSHSNVHASLVFPHLFRRPLYPLPFCPQSCPLQETRMSFVKLSAGKRGHAPAHDVTAPPPSSAVARLAPSSASSSSPDDEGKSQQAADCSGCAWGGGGSKSPTLYYERSNPLCRKPCVGVGNSSTPSLSSARPRSSKRFFIDGGGGGGDGGAAVGVAAAAVAGGGLYSDNSCSVCLDDYEEGDELLQVTCGHVFHRACIDHWLKGHRVCPCCRWGSLVLYRSERFWCRTYICTPAITRDQLGRTFAREGIK